MVACTHLWTGEGQLGVWQERIRKTGVPESGVLGWRGSSAKHFCGELQ